MSKYCDGRNELTSSVPLFEFLSHTPAGGDMVLGSCLGHVRVDPCAVADRLCSWASL